MRYRGIYDLNMLRVLKKDDFIYGWSFLESPFAIKIQNYRQLEFIDLTVDVSSVELNLKIVIEILLRNRNAL